MICDICGKEVKHNLEMHQRSKSCQAALKEQQAKEEIKGKGEFPISNIQHNLDKTATDKIVPKLHNNVSEIKNKDENIGFNTFFESLKNWEPPVDKRTLFDKVLRRKSQGIETKLCVFVADGEEPQCKYLPIDPNSQLLVNPDSGEVYLKPLRGDILFFDKYKCLPLSDCPKVEKEYDLPEHLALKFYNLGFGEAELSGYKTLIEKINKWQFQVTMSMAVALIVTLACAYMFKTNAEQVEMMQSTVDILSKMYGK